MPTEDSSKKVDNSTETTAQICLQHGRYWPCRRLVPSDREHEWTTQRVWATYAEREDEHGS